MQTRSLAACVLFATSTACAPLNPGVPGSAAVTEPAVDGTIFTVVFENENADDVIVPSNPTFYDLAHRYARADAYISSLHPSLPNYIVMTSGQDHGITSSAGPLDNVRIQGREHLAEQLDDAGIPWRAYMESMGEPCRMETEGLYVANHNPFVYYTSLTDDVERCRERVVDFHAHFAEDLAANRYRYVFITPNQCSNMHDCPAATADAFLATLVEQILASPGYRHGGALFILFDEGHLRAFGAGANLPTIVVSERLVAPGFATDTRFDHRSYLATIQDIFGLERLPTTVDATPMSELFRARSDLDAGAPEPTTADP